MKQTKTTARLTHTCDTCAHTYVLDVYIMIQLQHCSTVAACRGYTSRDSVDCCAYARMRVHVPGTLYIIHTLQQQTATAVLIVVLQLRAVLLLLALRYIQQDR